ncbi:hypothetical protein ACLESD_18795 [Pyxidicoccus sp. 3LFB2]
MDAALPSGTFVQGENSLAVMVKQHGRTSPEVSFDLQLGAAQPLTR